jgi:hypothetical protein
MTPAQEQPLLSTRITDDLFKVQLNRPVQMDEIIKQRFETVRFQVTSSATPIHLRSFLNERFIFCMTTVL